ncbi:evolutionarily conserved signaling intermediate in Toll pathway, mitochondrial isoform X1 [Stigmatopora argus]
MPVEPAATPEAGDGSFPGKRRRSRTRGVRRREPGGPPRPLRRRGQNQGFLHGGAGDLHPRRREASGPRGVHLRRAGQDGRVWRGARLGRLQSPAGRVSQGGLCAQELHPAHVQPLPEATGVWRASAGADGELRCVSESRRAFKTENRRLFHGIFFPPMCPGVIPNVETKVLLLRIFGEKGHPTRKYQRMMYWFPKFKNLNPFPVPHQLTRDPVELAHFSLKRIANDLDGRVTVFQAPGVDVTEWGEQVTRAHLVGIQSPQQMELLRKHDPGRPVFVEGPFPLWLRKTCVHYYILRAEPVPPGEQVEEPYDPERCFFYPLQLDLDLDRDLGEMETFDVEDLDEGPVFAMCMTNQGDQVTLNRWISGLQESNPILGHIPTLFRLEGGPRELRAETPKEAGPPEEEEEAAAERVRN